MAGSTGWEADLVDTSFSLGATLAERRQRLQRLNVMILAGSSDSHLQLGPAFGRAGRMEKMQLGDTLSPGLTENIDFLA